MKLTENEKRNVAEALYDIEKAYWLLNHTLNTQLPCRVKGDWLTQSYLETGAGGTPKEMTEWDWKKLSMAKEDFRLFHDKSASKARYLLSDAMGHFYDIANQMKLNYKHDNDIHEEVKKEVTKEFDDYLCDWWPSRSSDPTKDPYGIKAKADARNGEEE